MIDLNQLAFHGERLRRPECVLCTGAGNLYVSDWRGGVACIHPDGSQELFLANAPGFDVKPNGIALMPDGSFLLAHLGNDDGGVHQLGRNGELKPFLLEVDGKPLPPTNFVHLDFKGRIWITVSTRVCPRAKAYRPTANDGFIVLYENGNARIAADHLGYANECVAHPNGQWLYVNETFARKLSRFRIQPNGDLSGKETVAEFGEGVFPDGLAFDEEGGAWIASIVSNRVIRVDENGAQTVMLEDGDMEHVRWVEEAFQNHEMDRPHLDQTKSKRLKNISSLAFGGPGMKTAYLGCLLGEKIATFQSAVAGAKPAHWDFDD